MLRWLRLGIGRVAGKVSACAVAMGDNAASTFSAALSLTPAAWATSTAGVC